jgi:Domain of unknown function (DUF6249)
MSSDLPNATFLIARAGRKSLNPNCPVNASYDQSTDMKKLILLCICLVALAISLPGQTPTTSPIASPTAAATTTTATTATPITATSASPSDLADRIHQKLQRKFHGKHGIIIDGSAKHEDTDLETVRDFAIPIVAIVFLSIFGAPVLIVILIGMFAVAASRNRQRTIRMMVERGQPVPAELLAPEVRHVRRRSDVRRGVVWTMVGLGLMIWLGAVNDWEGGAWSFGLIPFLIGLGYLIVWKLEGKKDVPPPPPAP